MGEMTSTRPYFVRALHEWLEDNGHTAYILVDAFVEGTVVPQQYVKDGRIVLNISSSAVRSLMIDNDGISFAARFNAVPMEIYVPIYAVLGIYSKENGKGMFFEQGGDLEPPPPPSGTKQKPLKSVKTEKKESKPSLKVVK